MKKQIIEKPILFKSEMVNALLEGRKTVTRRLVFPQLPEYVDYFEYKQYGDSEWPYACFRGYVSAPPGDSIIYFTKPKYWPGLLLWVKETWGITDFYFRPKLPLNKLSNNKYISLKYKADNREKDFVNIDEELWHKLYLKGVWINRNLLFQWRSSLFMPKDVYRISLKITDVKIERLHELDDIDAMLEGCKNRENYARLWNEINKKGGILWEDNPWVYRIQFEILPERVGYD